MVSRICFKIPARGVGVELKQTEPYFDKAMGREGGYCLILLCVLENFHNKQLKIKQLHTDLT